MYCVYLTIYFGVKLPRRYIGSSKVERVKSGYNGTIKSKTYKKIYQEEQLNNKHLFKTRILRIFDSSKDAIEFEKELQLKYSAHKNPNYINMSIATPNGCYGRDVKGNKHPFYGKSHSEETKSVISKILSEKFKSGELISPFKNMDHSGENNGFYGKTHTEESKNKMRKPKKFVPKFKCPHCDKMYDCGNLKQHLKRNGYSITDYEKIINDKQTTRIL